MTRSEFLFILIDTLFHPMQNYRRYKGMVTEKDFVYNEECPKFCAMDIVYDPKRVAEKEKLPVFLNIHGGGFVKGDKKHRHSLSKRFANKGYFVANINYRVSPAYKIPTPIIDCIDALNYLENFKDKFNLDLDKVVLSGDSAGAYFATEIVAAYSNDDMRKKLGAPEIKIKPAALLSFCGPYDLVASITLTKLPFNIVWDIGRCYLGKEFGLKKDFSNIDKHPLLLEASPANWVNKNWCPSFLVMSDKDIFCGGQGDILEKKLLESGVPVATYHSTKLLDNHCFHLDMYKKVSKEAFRLAYDFLDRTLQRNQYAVTAEAETVAEAAATEAE